MPKSSQNRSQNHQKSSQNRPLDPPRNPTWTKVAFETPYFPLSGSKSVSNGTPTSTKNRSFFGHDFGTLLGTTFSCFWPPFALPKDHQNEIQKGPQNRSKIDHFLDLFLNDFLEPLFHAFGLHLGSQNDPKKRPQRDLRREHENIRFCGYLLHLRHIEGSWKSSFLVLFWNPF